VALVVTIDVFARRNTRKEPLINVSEAAKTKAKIREKAQFMRDKCAF